LFPLEGFPVSRLPSWPNAEVRVLAAPALGARFAEYLIDMQPGAAGSFPSDHRAETFYYVLSGAARLDDAEVRTGSFGLLPPTDDFSVRASDTTRMIVLRKIFEPAALLHASNAKPVHGHEASISAQAWADNPHARLQTLIPDNLQYDMAVNIFTFDPGHGLPCVETHVMEHGLWFLEGKGLYFLDGEWMEVEKDDFIWMGPYCPQSFYATGPTPAKYIYYKNVNRDIEL
jgi:(S)-ureidoglycine aminohydrolase